MSKNLKKYKSSLDNINNIPEKTLKMLYVFLTGHTAVLLLNKDLNLKKQIYSKINNSKDDKDYITEKEMKQAIVCSNYSDEILNHIVKEIEYNIDLNDKYNSSVKTNISIVTSGIAIMISLFSLTSKFADQQENLLFLILYSIFIVIAFSLIFIAIYFYMIRDNYLLFKLRKYLIDINNS